jgi:hypothetical protein
MAISRSVMSVGQAGRGERKKIKNQYSGIWYCCQRLFVSPKPDSRAHNMELVIVNLEPSTFLQPANQIKPLITHIVTEMHLRTRGDEENASRPGNYATCSFYRGNQGDGAKARAKRRDHRRYMGGTGGGDCGKVW